MVKVHDGAAALRPGLFTGPDAATFCFSADLAFGIACLRARTGQLGVAVPRYAPPPKKKKYFAAMERFTTKVMNDDCEVALDLKKTPAEHTLLDGLLSKCPAFLRRFCRCVPR